MPYADLEIIKTLKDNPPFSPIIRLVNLNGEKVIWKDYSDRRWWVKDTWGKILIAHECTVLKRLQGTNGVPRFIKRYGEYGFLSEYIEGEPLSKFTPQTLSHSVFDKLSQLVSRIHQCGVVHLDLGQKRNILLDKNYQPYFVDFANALYFRPEAFGFGQLFNMLRLIDHSALLKFRHRLFPDTLTTVEKRWLNRFFFSRRFWIFKPKKYRLKDKVLL